MSRTQAEKTKKSARKARTDKTYKTHNYGDVRIIEYNRYHDLTLRFLRTGSEITINNFKNLFTGSVKDPAQKRVYRGNRVK